ncbi:hypothetical protein [Mesorhizobium sp. B2-2-2]|uniref:hypothetical protein n=1 Tax=Mesorhizobium sp. B2-2-2 TaxID=2589964 RepID=UPI0015E287BD|nr:hypothetical protein [Mesorhizobium sp. B2-2-2]
MKSKKRRTRILRIRVGLVDGLASLLTVMDEPRRRKRRSPASALREDFATIGADMYRVVDRERADEKARRKAVTAAE